MRTGVVRAPRARRLAAGTMIVARQRLVGSNYRKRLRGEMIGAYGGKCSCCAETIQEFLTLEHLEGGGREHRRNVGYNGQAQLVDLKRQGWPSGYTILCLNCNIAKGRHGTCPHTWSPTERFVD